MRHPATFRINDEFVEIPVHFGVGDTILRSFGQPGVERMASRSLDVEFFRNRKIDAVGCAAKFDNLLGASGFLPAELVAGAADQTDLSSKILVEFLKLAVLRGVAAFRSHVHNEQRATFEAVQIEGRTIGAEEGDFIEIGHFNLLGGVTIGKNRPTGESCRQKEPGTSSSPHKRRLSFNLVSRFDQFLFMPTTKPFLADLLTTAEKYLGSNRLNALFSQASAFVHAIEAVDPTAFDTLSARAFELVTKCYELRFHTEQTDIDALLEFSDRLLDALYQRGFPIERIAQFYLFDQAFFWHSARAYEKGVQQLNRQIDRFRPQLDTDRKLRIRAALILITITIHRVEAGSLEAARAELRSFLHDNPTEQALLLYASGKYELHVTENNAKAYDFFRRAYRQWVFDEEADWVVLSKSLEGMGIASHEMLRYVDARNYFSKQFHIGLKLFPPNSTSYMNLGNCGSQHAGEKLYYYRKAEAMEIAISGPRASRLAEIYFNLSTHYLLVQDHQAVVSYADKALDIIQEHEGWQDFEQYVRLQLASGYFYLDQFERAIDQLPLTEADPADYRIVDISQRLIVARAAAQLDRHDQATTALNRAFEALAPAYSPAHEIWSSPNLLEHPHKLSVFEAYFSKAEILLCRFQSKAGVLDDLYAGLLNVRLYAAMLDKRMAEIDNRHTKVEEFQQIYANYRVLLSLLMRCLSEDVDQNALFGSCRERSIRYNRTAFPPDQFQYPAGAADVERMIFSLIEHDKSIELLKAVTDKQAHRLPADLAARYDRFNADLNRQQKHLHITEAAFFADPPTDADEEMQAFKHILELRSNYVDALEAYRSFKEKYAKYYATESATDRLSTGLHDPKKLQTLLSDHQGVVNYFIFENQLYICFLSSEHSSYQSAQLPPEFEQLTVDYVRAIDRFDTDEQFRIGQLLSQQLIAPLEASLKLRPIEQLFIIPHSYLNPLPFETLFHRPVKANTLLLFGEAPPYLIEKYAISYHFSASLLAHSLAESPPAKPDSYAGYAPVYKSSPDVAGEAVADSVRPLPEYDEAVRSVRIGGTEYQALLHSEAEIDSVRALFAANDHQAKTYLHEQATIDTFIETASSPSVIHIAAHSFELSAEMNLSGIVFSPDESDQSDSVFYLQDTYNLCLNSDLVILSCCNSGIGRYVGSEGVMAINRGFIRAGAANVLYTLFKIYDRSGSLFVQHFFKLVVEGGYGYSAALRQTKLHFIDSGEFEAAKHWAGFVLIGR